MDRASVDPGQAQQSHADVQGQLRDLGFRLGFDVWIASNDQSRADQNGTLGQGCPATLPSAIQTIAGGDAVRLIDVLWLEKETRIPIATFEVEHSTSIYSGIDSMLDLALGFKANNCPIRLFLVAPDKRADEVRSQLRRPAFSMVQDTTFFFIPYGELQRHFEPMSRFGHGFKAVEAISEKLNPRLISS